MSYKFDVEKNTKLCIEWIKNWFEENGKGCNAIVGISGGKDSTVVAALCCEALGKDRVIGVLMPNGEQKDINVAKDVVKYLGIKSYEINIENSVSGILGQMAFSNEKRQGEKISLTDQTMINLPARIRMATLYAVAQSLNGRVANTCNLSEDWVGYATRYGDSVGDFSPLSGFTVTEVKQIGYFLNLPERFIEKIPQDGLCDKTDEDNFGFSYKVLDKYIRTKEIDDLKIKSKIDEMHKKNLFKLKLMDSFKPNLSY